MRGLEMRKGFLGAPEAHKQCCEVYLGLGEVKAGAGVVRIDAQCRLKMRDIYEMLPAQRLQERCQGPRERRE